MKNIIFVLCFLGVGLIGVINSTSTTGRPTSRPPTQRTTTRPRNINCYACSSCPLPFPNNYYSQTVSYSGWCLKMSVSELPQAVATRGADVSGYCISRGCSWRTVSGIRTYLCCCNGNLCNTAVSTSKLSILTLLLSFLVISFAKNNF